MLFMHARFFAALEDVTFIQWKGSCMQRLNTKSGGQIIALQMISRDGYSKFLKVVYKNACYFLSRIAVK